MSGLSKRKARFQTVMNYSVHEAGHICGACQRNLPVDAKIGSVLMDVRRAALRRGGVGIVIPRMSTDETASTAGWKQPPTEEERASMIADDWKKS